MDDNILIFLGLVIFFLILIKWIFFPKKKFEAFDENWKMILAKRVKFYTKLNHSIT